MNTINNDEKRLLALAEGIVSNKIELLYGVREMLKLRTALENLKGDILSTFIMVDSDTDELPVGKTRELCSSKFLEESDKKLEAYLVETKSLVVDQCREIIRKIKEKS